MLRNAGPLGRQAKQLTDTSAAKRSVCLARREEPGWTAEVVRGQRDVVKLQRIHDGCHRVGGVRECRR